MGQQTTTPSLLQLKKIDQKRINLSRLIAFYARKNLETGFQKFSNSSLKIQDIEKEKDNIPLRVALTLYCATAKMMNKTSRLSSSAIIKSIIETLKQITSDSTVIYDQSLYKQIESLMLSLSSPDTTENGEQTTSIERESQFIELALQFALATGRLHFSISAVNKLLSESASDFRKSVNKEFIESLKQFLFINRPALICPSSASNSLAFEVEYAQPNDLRVANDFLKVPSASLMQMLQSQETTGICSDGLYIYLHTGRWIHRFGSGIGGGVVGREIVKDGEGRVLDIGTSQLFEFRENNSKEQSDSQSKSDEVNTFSGFDETSNGWGECDIAGLCAPYRQLVVVHHSNLDHLKSKAFLIQQSANRTPAVSFSPSPSPSPLSPSLSLSINSPASRAATSPQQKLMQLQDCCIMSFFDAESLECVERCFSESHFPILLELLESTKKDEASESKNMSINNIFASLFPSYSEKTSSKFSLSSIQIPDVLSVVSQLTKTHPQLHHALKTNWVENLRKEKKRMIIEQKKQFQRLRDKNYKEEDGADGSNNEIDEEKKDKDDIKAADTSEVKEQSEGKQEAEEDELNENEEIKIDEAIAAELMAIGIDESSNGAQSGSGTQSHFDDLFDERDDDVMLSDRRKAKADAEDLAENSAELSFDEWESGRDRDTLHKLNSSDEHATSQNEHNPFWLSVSQLSRMGYKSFTRFTTDGNRLFHIATLLRSSEDPVVFLLVTVFDRVSREDTKISSDSTNEANVNILEWKVVSRHLLNMRTLEATGNERCCCSICSSEMPAIGALYCPICTQIRNGIVDSTTLHETQNKNTNSTDSSDDAYSKRCERENAKEEKQLEEMVGPTLDIGTPNEEFSMNENNLCNNITPSSLSLQLLENSSHDSKNMHSHFLVCNKCASSSFKSSTHLATHPLDAMPLRREKQVTFDMIRNGSISCVGNTICICPGSNKEQKDKSKANKASQGNILKGSKLKEKEESLGESARLGLQFDPFCEGKMCVDWINKMLIARKRGDDAQKDILVIVPSSFASNVSIKEQEKGLRDSIKHNQRTLFADIKEKILSEGEKKMTGSELAYLILSHLADVSSSANGQTYSEDEFLPLFSPHSIDVGTQLFDEFQLSLELLCKSLKAQKSSEEGLIVAHAAAFMLNLLKTNILSVIRSPYSLKALGLSRAVFTQIQKNLSNISFAISELMETGCDPKQVEILSVVKEEALSVSAIMATGLSESASASVDALSEIIQQRNPESQKIIVFRSSVSEILQHTFDVIPQEVYQHIIFSVFSDPKTLRKAGRMSAESNNSTAFFKGISARRYPIYSLDSLSFNADSSSSSVNPIISGLLSILSSLIQCESIASVKECDRAFCPRSLPSSYSSDESSFNLRLFLLFLQRQLFSLFFRLIPREGFAQRNVQNIKSSIEADKDDQQNEDEQQSKESPLSVPAESIDPVSNAVFPFFAHYSLVLMKEAKAVAYHLIRRIREKIESESNKQLPPFLKANILSSIHRCLIGSLLRPLLPLVSFISSLSVDASALFAPSVFSLISVLNNLFSYLFGEFSEKPSEDKYPSTSSSNKLQLPPLHSLHPSEFYSEQLRLIRNTVITPPKLITTRIFTSHPYKNNEDWKEIVFVPSALGYRIKFNSQCKTEQRYDFLTISLPTRQQMAIAVEKSFSTVNSEQTTSSSPSSTSPSSHSHTYRRAIRLPKKFHEDGRRLALYTGSSFPKEELVIMQPALVFSFFSDKSGVDWGVDCNVVPIIAQSSIAIGGVVKGEDDEMLRIKRSIMHKTIAMKRKEQLSFEKTASLTPSAAALLSITEQQKGTKKKSEHKEDYIGDGLWCAEMIYALSSLADCCTKKVFSRAKGQTFAPNVQITHSSVSFSDLDASASASASASSSSSSASSSLEVVSTETPQTLSSLQSMSEIECITLVKHLNDNSCEVIRSLISFMLKEIDSKIATPIKITPEFNTNGSNTKSLAMNLIFSCSDSELLRIAQKAIKSVSLSSLITKDSEQLVNCVSASASFLRALLKCEVSNHLRRNTAVALLNEIISPVDDLAHSLFTTLSIQQISTSAHFIASTLFAPSMRSKIFDDGNRLSFDGLRLLEGVISLLNKEISEFAKQHCVSSLLSSSSSAMANETTNLSLLKRHSAMLLWISPQTALLCSRISSILDVLRTVGSVLLYFLSQPLSKESKNLLEKGVSELSKSLRQIIMLPNCPTFEYTKMKVIAISVLRSMLFALYDKSLCIQEEFIPLRTEVLAVLNDILSALSFSFEADAFITTPRAHLGLDMLEATMKNAALLKHFSTIKKSKSFDEKAQLFPNEKEEQSDAVEKSLMNNSKASEVVLRDSIEMCVAKVSFCRTEEEDWCDEQVLNLGMDRNYNTIDVVALDDTVAYDALSLLRELIALNQFNNDFINSTKSIYEKKRLFDSNYQFSPIETVARLFVTGSPRMKEAAAECFAYLLQFISPAEATNKDKCNVTVPILGRCYDFVDILMLMLSLANINRFRFILFKSINKYLSDRELQSKQQSSSLSSTKDDHAFYFLILCVRLMNSTETLTHNFSSLAKLVMEPSSPLIKKLAADSVPYLLLSRNESLQTAANPTKYLSSSEELFSVISPFLMLPKGDPSILLDAKSGAFHSMIGGDQLDEATLTVGVEWVHHLKQCLQKNRTGWNRSDEQNISCSSASIIKPEPSILEFAVKSPFSETPSPESSPYPSLYTSDSPSDEPSQSKSLAQRASSSFEPEMERRLCVFIASVIRFFAVPFRCHSASSLRNIQQKVSYLIKSIIKNKAGEGELNWSSFLSSNVKGNILELPTRISDAFSWLSISYENEEDDKEISFTDSSCQNLQIARIHEIVQSLSALTLLKADSVSPHSEGVSEHQLNHQNVAVKQTDYKAGLDLNCKVQSKDVTNEEKGNNCCDAECAANKLENENSTCSSNWPIALNLFCYQSVCHDSTHSENEMEKLSDMIGAITKQYEKQNDLNRHMLQNGKESMEHPMMLTALLVLSHANLIIRSLISELATDCLSHSHSSDFSTTKGVFSMYPLISFLRSAFNSSLADIPESALKLNQMIDKFNETTVQNDLAYMLSKNDIDNVIIDEAQLPSFIDGKNDSVMKINKKKKEATETFKKEKGEEGSSKNKANEADESDEDESSSEGLNDISKRLSSEVQRLEALKASRKRAAMPMHPQYEDEPIVDFEDFDPVGGVSSAITTIRPVVDQSSQASSSASSSSTSSSVFVDKYLSLWESSSSFFDVVTTVCFCFCRRCYTLGIAKCACGAFLKSRSQIIDDSAMDQFICEECGSKGRIFDSFECSCRFPDDDESDSSSLVDSLSDDSEKKDDASAAAVPQHSNLFYDDGPYDDEEYSDEEDMPMSHLPPPIKKKKKKRTHEGKLSKAEKKQIRAERKKEVAKEKRRMKLIKSEALSAFFALVSRLELKAVGLALSSGKEPLTCLLHCKKSSVARFPINGLKTLMQWIPNERKLFCPVDNDLKKKGLSQPERGTSSMTLESGSTGESGVGPISNADGVAIVSSAHQSDEEKNEDEDGWDRSRIIDYSEVKHPSLVVDPNLLWAEDDLKQKKKRKTKESKKSTNVQEHLQAPYNLSFKQREFDSLGCEWSVLPCFLSKDAIESFLNVPPSTKFERMRRNAFWMSSKEQATQLIESSKKMLPLMQAERDKEERLISTIQKTASSGKANETFAQNANLLIPPNLVNQHLPSPTDEHLLLSPFSALSDSKYAKISCFSTIYPALSPLPLRIVQETVKSYLRTTIADHIDDWKKGWSSIEFAPNQVPMRSLPHYSHVARLMKDFMGKSLFFPPYLVMSFIHSLSLSAGDRVLIVSGDNYALSAAAARLVRPGGIVMQPMSTDQFQLLKKIQASKQNKLKVQISLLPEATRNQKREQREKEKQTAEICLRCHTNPCCCASMPLYDSLECDFPMNFFPFVSVLLAMEKDLFTFDKILITGAVDNRSLCHALSLLDPETRDACLIYTEIDEGRVVALYPNHKAKNAMKSNENDATSTHFNGEEHQIIKRMYFRLNRPTVVEGIPKGGVMKLNEEKAEIILNSSVSKRYLFRIKDAQHVFLNSFIEPETEKRENSHSNTSSTDMLGGALTSSSSGPFSQSTSLGLPPFMSPKNKSKGLYPFVCTIESQVQPSFLGFSLGIRDRQSGLDEQGILQKFRQGAQGEWSSVQCIQEGICSVFATPHELINNPTKPFLEKKMKQIRKKERIHPAYVFNEELESRLPKMPEDPLLLPCYMWNLLSSGQLSELANRSGSIPFAISPSSPSVSSLPSAASEHSSSGRKSHDKDRSSAVSVKMLPLIAEIGMTSMVPVSHQAKLYIELSYISCFHCGLHDSEGLCISCFVKCHDHRHRRAIEGEGSQDSEKKRLKPVSVKKNMEQQLPVSSYGGPSFALSRTMPPRTLNPSKDVNIRSCEAFCDCCKSKHQDWPCFCNPLEHPASQLESNFSGHKKYSGPPGMASYTKKDKRELLDDIPRPGDYIWISASQEIFPPFFISTKTAMKLVKDGEQVTFMGRLWKSTNEEEKVSDEAEIEELSSETKEEEKVELKEESESKAFEQPAIASVSDEEQSIKSDEPELKLKEPMKKNHSTAKALTLLLLKCADQIHLPADEKIEDESSIKSPIVEEEFKSHQIKDKRALTLAILTALKQNESKKLSESVDPVVNAKKLSRGLSSSQDSKIEGLSAKPSQKAKALALLLLNMHSKDSENVKKSALAKSSITNAIPSCGSSHKGLSLLLLTMNHKKNESKKLLNPFCSSTIGGERSSSEMSKMSKALLLLILTKKIGRGKPLQTSLPESDSAVSRLLGKSSPLSSEAAHKSWSKLDSNSQMPAINQSSAFSPSKKQETEVKDEFWKGGEPDLTTVSSKLGAVSLLLLTFSMAKDKSTSSSTAKISNEVYNTSVFKRNSSEKPSNICTAESNQRISKDVEKEDRSMQNKDDSKRRNAKKGALLLLSLTRSYLKDMSATDSFHQRNPFSTSCREQKVISQDSKPSSGISKTNYKNMAKALDLLLLTKAHKTDKKRALNLLMLTKNHKSDKKRALSLLLLTKERKAAKKRALNLLLLTKAHKSEEKQSVESSLKSDFHFSENHSTNDSFNADSTCPITQSGPVAFGRTNSAVSSHTFVSQPPLTHISFGRQSSPSSSIAAFGSTEVESDQESKSAQNESIPLRFGRSSFDEKKDDSLKEEKEESETKTPSSIQAEEKEGADNAEEPKRGEENSKKGSLEKFQSLTMEIEKELKEAQQLQSEVDADSEMVASLLSDAFSAFEDAGLPIDMSMFEDFGIMKGLGGAKEEDEISEIEEKSDDEDENRSEFEQSSGGKCSKSSKHQHNKKFRRFWNENEKLLGGASSDDEDESEEEESTSESDDDDDDDDEDDDDESSLSSSNSDSEDNSSESSYDAESLIDDRENLPFMKEQTLSTNSQLCISSSPQKDSTALLSGSFPSERRQTSIQLDLTKDLQVAGASLPYELIEKKEANVMNNYKRKCKADAMWTVITGSEQKEINGEQKCSEDKEKDMTKRNKHFSLKDKLVGEIKEKMRELEIKGIISQKQHSSSETDKNDPQRMAEMLVDVQDRAYYSTIKAKQQKLFNQPVFAPYAFLLKDEEENGVDGSNAERKDGVQDAVFELPSTESMLAAERLNADAFPILRSLTDNEIASSSETGLSNPLLIPVPKGGIFEEGAEKEIKNTFPSGILTEDQEKSCSTPYFPPLLSGDLTGTQFSAGTFGYQCAMRSWNEQVEAGLKRNAAVIEQSNVESKKPGNLMQMKVPQIQKEKENEGSDEKETFSEAHERWIAHRDGTKTNLTTSFNIGQLVAYYPRSSDLTGAGTQRKDEPVYQIQDNSLEEGEEYKEGKERPARIISMNGDKSRLFILIDEKEKGTQQLLWVDSSRVRVYSHLSCKHHCGMLAWDEDDNSKIDEIEARKNEVTVEDLNALAQKSSTSSALKEVNKDEVGNGDALSHPTDKTFFSQTNSAALFSHGEDDSKLSIDPQKKVSFRRIRENVPSIAREVLAAEAELSRSISALTFFTYLLSIPSCRSNSSEVDAVVPSFASYISGLDRGMVAGAIKRLLSKHLVVLPWSVLRKPASIRESCNLAFDSLASPMAALHALTLQMVRMVRDEAKTLLSKCIKAPQSEDSQKLEYSEETNGWKCPTAATLCCLSSQLSHLEDYDIHGKDESLIGFIVAHLNSSIYNWNAIAEGLVDADSSFFSLEMLKSEAFTETVLCSASSLSSNSFITPSLVDFYRTRIGEMQHKAKIDKVLMTPSSLLLKDNTPTWGDFFDLSKTQIAASPHPYKGHSSFACEVHIPGASGLHFIFDKNCETADADDELLFCDPEKGTVLHSCSGDAGRYNWSDFTLSNINRVELKFNVKSDLEPTWGWKVYVVDASGSSAKETSHSKDQMEESKRFLKKMRERESVIQKKMEHRLLKLKKKNKKLSKKDVEFENEYNLRKDVMDCTKISSNEEIDELFSELSPNVDPLDEVLLSHPKHTLEFGSSKSASLLPSLSSFKKQFISTSWNDEILKSVKLIHQSKDGYHKDNLESATSEGSLEFIIWSIQLLLCLPLSVSIEQTEKKLLLDLSPFLYPLLQIVYSMNPRCKLLPIFSFLLSSLIHRSVTCLSELSAAEFLSVRDGLPILQLEAFRKRIESEEFEYLLPNSVALLELKAEMSCLCELCNNERKDDASLCISSLSLKSSSSSSETVNEYLKSSFPLYVSTEDLSLALDLEHLQQRLFEDFHLFHSFFEKYSTNELLGLHSKSDLPSKHSPAEQIMLLRLLKMVKSHIMLFQALLYANGTDLRPLCNSLDGKSCLPSIKQESDMSIEYTFKDTSQIKVENVVFSNISDDTQVTVKSKKFNESESPDAAKDVAVYSNKVSIGTIKFIEGNKVCINVKSSEAKSASKGTAILTLTPKFENVHALEDYVNADNFEIPQIPAIKEAKLSDAELVELVNSKMVASNVTLIRNLSDPQLLFLIFPSFISKPQIALYYCIRLSLILLLNKTVSSLISTVPVHLLLSSSYSFVQMMLSLKHLLLMPLKINLWKLHLSSHITRELFISPSITRHRQRLLQLQSSSTWNAKEELKEVEMKASSINVKRDIVHLRVESGKPIFVQAMNALADGIERGLIDSNDHCFVIEAVNVKAKPQEFMKLFKKLCSSDNSTHNIEAEKVHLQATYEDYDGCQPTSLELIDPRMEIEEDEEENSEDAIYASGKKRKGLEKIEKTDQELIEEDENFDPSADFRALLSDLGLLINPFMSESAKANEREKEAKRKRERERKERIKQEKMKEKLKMIQAMGSGEREAEKDRPCRVVGFEGENAEVVGEMKECLQHISEELNPLCRNSPFNKQENMDDEEEREEQLKADDNKLPLLSVCNDNETSVLILNSSNSPAGWGLQSTSQKEFFEMKRKYLRFFGVIMGVCALSGYPLSLPLASSFWSLLAGNCESKASDVVFCASDVQEIRSGLLQIVPLEIILEMTGNDLKLFINEGFLSNVRKF
eukprot:MONOS_985.1-p1 / transcript=MONOS_985.1 / gene=MONOS_985 / organism=Monocercomonoides_exilis_PA203 / gene_product=unspecified product / transcript_product=unspecified product / location=Mono_scaffold00016:151466-174073(-) / protein_length=7487 / sequence_SO=supercontig / SO=protein_coding / is_pseudo=false